MEQDQNFFGNWKSSIFFARGYFYNAFCTRCFLGRLIMLLPEIHDTSRTTDYMLVGFTGNYCYNLRIIWLDFELIETRSRPLQGCNSFALITLFLLKVYLSYKEQEPDLLATPAVVGFGWYIYVLFK